MRTLLWITRPEMAPFAGAQHEALQARLREQGWRVTVIPYQNRLLWRQRQACDVLVWTFVPTQLEVWLARRVAGAQFGLIHELAPQADTLPGLDHWLTPSASLRGALTAAGVAGQDVSVITTPPVPSPRSVNDVRAACGLAADTPFVYAGGPAAPQAGNRIAVWALNILNYVHPGVHLVVHGEGAERERLEHFNRSIDERRRVHFAPASVATADLVAQADQVWLPRQWDGTPDAFWLALRHGKPIVAARQPSLGEWLRHESNALLVRHGQPAEWARAAKRLLEDPALCAALAEAARRTVVAQACRLDPFETRVRSARGVAA